MTDKMILPHDLQMLQSTAEAPVVVDVRGAEEYNAGHVQGAVNIPIDELEERLDELPDDRLVVTYCNMQHRGSSRGEQAAGMLDEQGYRAQALDGGFPGWRDAGYPVETE
jgi:phage shock protein E